MLSVWLVEEFMSAFMWRRGLLFFHRKQETRSHNRMPQVFLYCTWCVGECMGITHLPSRAEERRSGWREGCTVFGVMKMEFHSKYRCFGGVSYAFLSRIHAALTWHCSTFKRQQAKDSLMFCVFFWWSCDTIASTCVSFPPGVMLELQVWICGMVALLL